MPVHRRRSVGALRCMGSSFRRDGTVIRTITHFLRRLCSSAWLHVFVPRSSNLDSALRAGLLRSLQGSPIPRKRRTELAGITPEVVL